jgi:hypothetical protein
LNLKSAEPLKRCVLDGLQHTLSSDDRVGTASTGLVSVRSLDHIDARPLDSADNGAPAFKCSVFARIAVPSFVG